MHGVWTFGLWQNHYTASLYQFEFLFPFQFLANATICVDSLYKWMRIPNKKKKEKWHKPFRNWRSFLCTYRLVRISFPQQYEKNNDDDEFDVPFNYKKPWKATMHRKFPLTLSKYVSYILTINLLSQWEPALQVNLYWF